MDLARPGYLPHTLLIHYPQAHSRDFYRATPLFNIRDGFVIKAWKNSVGVEHIFIANGNGKMVFGGFVGWIHSETLRQAITQIREEFT